MWTRGQRLWRDASAALAISALALSTLAIACTTPTPAVQDDDDGSGGSAGNQGTGGDGGTAEPACDMFAPRAQPLEVLIGPNGLQDTLIGLIDGAQSQVDLMMYELDAPGCIDALVRAHMRGVAVRVSVDDRPGNSGALSTLNAAGVPAQAAPAEFEHNHAKTLIIDEAFAVVMSANMNGYSFSSERNYGVIDRDPQDVAQLSAVFERDWTGSGDIDTSCTRLIISPLNARQRLLALIGSAETTLDLAVMYISDAEVKHALSAKMSQGVSVRVLFAMPEWIESNAATAQELSADGAETRYLYTHELHAKLVVADGVPFVGSENFSSTALDRNREVGVLVNDPGARSAITAQFETDWNAGVSAP